MRPQATRRWMELVIVQGRRWLSQTGVLGQV